MCERKELLKDSFNHIDSFIKKKNASSFTVIRGTFGIGKSLFLRKLLLKCHDKMDQYVNYIFKIYKINY